MASLDEVLIDLVYSSWFPLNSNTKVSFIIVVYGENAFWDAGKFFVALPQVTTGKKQ